MSLPDLSALFDWLAAAADALVALSSEAPWWTVALVAALTLRALLVLGRGPTGAAWRSVTAVAAGGIVVAQLALEGPDVALLPLHALAAVVVALVPWERPHPEAAPLRLGRQRRRRRAPWPRAALLLVATAGAVVGSAMI